MRAMSIRANEGVSIWVVGIRHSQARRARRDRSSILPTARSIATRPSTTFPKSWGTCDAGQDALFEYLRLGDNALILGHRLSEWCGHSPALEEDLALSNVALDLIGQTQLWLNLAGEVEGKGRDADKLAYLRDARGFRNVLLVEQPNGDFAMTMARQFYFDAWHYLLLRDLRLQG